MSQISTADKEELRGGIIRELKSILMSLHKFVDVTVPPLAPPELAWALIAIAVSALEDGYCDDSTGGWCASAHSLELLARHIKRALEAQRPAPQ